MYWGFLLWLHLGFWYILVNALSKNLGRIHLKNSKCRIASYLIHTGSTLSRDRSHFFWSHIRLLLLGPLPVHRRQYLFLGYSCLPWRWGILYKKYFLNLVLEERISLSLVISSQLSTPLYIAMDAVLLTSWRDLNRILQLFKNILLVLSRGEPLF